MQRPARTVFAYTFCFLSFAAFGYYHMQFNTSAPVETVDMASNVEFETAAQCSEDRNYFEKDLKKIALDFRVTRNQIESDQPARSCVTYIMKNFMPLDVPRSSRGMCKDDAGNSLRSPTKGVGDVGFKAACVTETYVNAVYNSMLDVSECFNIPMKELLPKLFNESGLHMNTLGPSYDTGIGQLTKSALENDVFEPYSDKYEKGQIGPRQNQQSGYEYYIQEMKKSSKPSCQRIAAQKSVYELLPKDAGASWKMCDSKYATASADPNCFKAWAFENRCLFMNAPENPLRNVLTMAMLYRNNLKNAAGITYVAGEDMLSQRPYRPGEPLNGYFARERYIERLQNLGVSHPSQEVIKQMIVSLGFNAGIGTAKLIFDDYLKEREAFKIKLSDRDFDFQTIDSSQWSFVTSAGVFWKTLASLDSDYEKKADNAVASLKSLGLSADADAFLKLRKDIQKKLKNVPADSAARKTTDLSLDSYRKQWLAKVNSMGAKLSFPEYAKIHHAHLMTVSTRYGGAPGYLSALASTYLRLEKDMGRGTCTPDQYLKF